MEEGVGEGMGREWRGIGREWGGVEEGVRERVGREGG